METQIQHFSHEHPLRFDGNIDRCLVCYQQGRTSDPVYSCCHKSCITGFSLHKSCAELLQETILNHPFHPHHTLTLLLNPPQNYSGLCSCDACGLIPWSFVYHCSECQFDLHPCCAFLTPTSFGQQHHHQGHGHPHPLIICESRTNFEFQCGCCKLPFKEGGTICVCLQCSCLLDESCAEWPSQIQHPFHPQHPLALTRLYPLTLIHLLPQFDNPDSTRASRCGACGKLLEGLNFHCSECQFSLDPICASLIIPAQYSEDGELKETHQNHQFSHPHPLVRCEKKEGAAFPLPCDACQCEFDSDDGSVYVCLDCKFFLHESCADLPREVRESHHHQHVLKLLEYSRRQAMEPIEIQHLLWTKRRISNPKSDSYLDKLARLEGHFASTRSGMALDLFNGSFECQACCRYTTGFAYACPECKFYFDISCPFSKPLNLVKSEVHQHPLAFFDDVQSQGLNCYACRQFLSTPLFRGREPPSTPFFRCADCNFNLHVSCVPALPPTVKSKHHRHLLRFTDSPIKDHPDEDETTEFYCDECEKPRKLDERTYYCEECHYVAHVHCFLPQIMRTLEEARSLACKLAETKSDMSASACEENSNTRVGKALMIEEIESHAVAADEVDKMASSSSTTVFSGVSADNAIAAIVVSLVVDSSSPIE